MQGRADIKNLAAILFEFSEGRAAHIEGAFQIDIDNRAEAVRRQLLGRAEKISGSAIDYYIDTAKVIDGCEDSFLNLFGFAYVGGNGNGFADT